MWLAYEHEHKLAGGGDDVQMTGALASLALSFNVAQTQLTDATQCGFYIAPGFPLTHVRGD